MKTIKLLLCAGWVAVACVCCKSTPSASPPMPDVYSPYYQCLLIMSFVDAEGNDLVEGIEIISDDGSDLVAPDQYTLTSSLPILVDTPGIRYDRHDLTPVPVLIQPEKIGEGKPDYNAFCFDAPLDRTLDLLEITYRFTCRHVFGDDEPHEIVTYWRKPTGWNEDWIGQRLDYYRTCYRVVVDGQEFTDISYTDSEICSYATIVLDR